MHSTDHTHKCSPSTDYGINPLQRSDLYHPQWRWEDLPSSCSVTWLFLRRSPTMKPLLMIGARTRWSSDSKPRESIVTLWSATTDLWSVPQSSMRRRTRTWSPGKEQGSNLPSELSSPSMALVARTLVFPSHPLSGKWRDVLGKIWPHSTQFWLWLMDPLLYKQLFLRHPLLPPFN